MQKNVLEYLENTVQKYPNKTAIIDEKSSINFEDLQNVRVGRKEHLPSGCQLLLGRTTLKKLRVAVNFHLDFSGREIPRLRTRKFKSKSSRRRMKKTVHPTGLTFQNRPQAAISFVKTGIRKDVDSVNRGNASFTKYIYIFFLNFIHTNIASQISNIVPILMEPQAPSARLDIYHY